MDHLRRPRRVQRHDLLGLPQPVDSQEQQLLLTQRLSTLADIDGLTWCLNRTALHTRLGSVAGAATPWRPVSVLLVDLDGFQAVNDTHGHAAGDELLVDVARALRAGVRETDAVGRLGGDEFAVVLHTTADQAAGPAVEKRFHHRDGHTVWTRVTARLVTAAGEPRYAVAAIENISERRDEEARLRWLALHDPLTGAANRALLDDRLDQALAARDRDGGLVGVMFCDVDAFKAVNDTHGHLAGDQVLVALAQRARSVIRDQDTLARVGGDEFVLVVHVPTRAELDQVTTRLRAAVTRPVRLPAGDVAVRASCGVAVVDAPGLSAAAVLAQADAAMYAAKRETVTGPGGARAPRAGGR